MVSDSLIHSLAGAAGGMVAMSATYPLVVISTRASVEAKKQSKSNVEAVRDIITKEGPLALYRGVGPSLFGIAVTNGFYYFFYESMRDIILKSRKGSRALSTPESMLSGLVAGSATSIFTNPIWVVQNIQIKPQDDLAPDEKHLNVLQTIRLLFKKGGFGAFFRGLTPALILVINPIIQYTVFEQLKNFLIKRRTAKLRAAGGLATAVAALSDWDYFFLGALSKLVATGITYPYIVVKNRLQAGAETATRYKSALHGLMLIAKEEGIEGLYRGMSSKLLQSVLTAAILFAGQKRIYELTKQALTVTPVLAK